MYNITLSQSRQELTCFCINNSVNRSRKEVTNSLISSFVHLPWLKSNPIYFRNVYRRNTISKIVMFYRWAHKVNPRMVRMKVPQYFLTLYCLCHFKRSRGGKGFVLSWLYSAFILSRSLTDKSRNIIWICNWEMRCDKLTEIDAKHVIDTCAHDLVISVKWLIS